MSFRLHPQQRAFLAGAALVVLLAGCVAQQGQSESAAAPGSGVLLPAPQPGVGGVIPGAGTLIPPSVPPPTQPLQSYPKTIQDSGAGQAVLSLYRKAQDARAAGHPDQADELLRRAHHIDSRNPFILQALAGTQLDLKQPDQAEEFARRSNDLARGNPYIEAGNWRLIATARQARGDSGGSVQAQARLDEIMRTPSGK